MKRQFSISMVLAALALFPLSGCIIIADFDPWDSDCKVWIDGNEERVSLEADGLNSVDVKTHSGAVTFTGATNDDTFVTYRVRAGARSSEDAQRALDAVEVFVDRGNDGVARLGWRWNQMKRSSWSASVSFKVNAPSDCDLEVETHNGPVTVTSLRGDADLETHNGAITVETTGHRLSAQTHNGSITASFAGRDVTLETHNGRIAADLSGCGTVDGHIVTHNGGVNVTLGDGASTMVRASTYNGGITCLAPIQDSQIERRRLTGRIGSGEGSLTINTHNGGVRIDKKQG